jgi:hypothetical protein
MTKCFIPQSFSSSSFSVQDGGGLPGWKRFEWRRQLAGVSLLSAAYENGRGREGLGDVSLLHHNPQPVVGDRDLRSRQCLAGFQQDRFFIAT